MKSALLYATFLFLPGALATCDKADQQVHALTPEVSVIAVGSSLRPEKKVVGHTVSSREAEVRSQVRGIVKEVLFTEGGMVQEGDILYRIEPDICLAAHDSARAALDKTGGKARCAAFAKAEQTLAYTEITAPISGHIGQSSVTVGSLVTEAQAAPLATIFQTKPMYVDMPVTVQEMNMLRATGAEDDGRHTADNITVRIQLGDGSWYAHSGKLRFTDAHINPETGSILCRAEFPNPDQELWLGLFVNVTGSREKSAPGLLIPWQAVQQDDEGVPYVLVVGKGETVEKRTICTGQSQGDHCLVTDGLAKGELIVVEGLQKARPGTAVLPRPFHPQNNAARTADSSVSIADGAPSSL